MKHLLQESNIFLENQMRSHTKSVCMILVDNYILIYLKKELLTY